MTVSLYITVNYGEDFFTLDERGLVGSLILLEDDEGLISMEDSFAGQLALE